MGGIFGIEGIIHASFAAIGSVRFRNLQHRTAGLLHVSEQTSSIGSGAFDANALELTIRAHPGEHLFISLPGAGEAAAAQDPVTLVNYSGDVKIFVGIDADNNKASRVVRFFFHEYTPVADQLDGSAATGFLDKTVRRRCVRPFLSHKHRPG